MVELIEDSQVRRYVVDPAALTQQERKALERIHSERLHRVRGGYVSRGVYEKITLHMVNRLMTRGLVRMGDRKGNRQPVLTSHGQEAMRIAIERRNRRK